MLLLLLLACPVPDPPAPGACVPALDVICTVIGTGDIGFNGDALAATDSWLYLPSALGWTPDAELAVVDYNNMRVRALAEDGSLRTIAGNGDHDYSTPGVPILASPMENPIDVVWAADGAMYLSASHEARVLRVGDDGLVTVVAGTGEEGNSGNGGPATSATMSAYLGGIALGDDDTLYIADTMNNCVRAVLHDGTIRTLPIQTSGPQGLTFADGALYIASTLDHEIRRYEPNSEIVSTVAAGLMYPWGVAMDEDGALIVADSGHNQVLRIDAAERTVLAGSGEAAYSGDGGDPHDASLSFPSDILLGPDTIYVADMRNAVVRAFGR